MLGDACISSRSGWLQELPAEIRIGHFKACHYFVCLAFNVLFPCQYIAMQDVKQSLTRDSEIAEVAIAILADYV